MMFFNRKDTATAIHLYSFNNGKSIYHGRRLIFSDYTLDDGTPIEDYEDYMFIDHEIPLDEAYTMFMDYLKEKENFPE
jgi:hypothetical protein